MTFIPSVLTKNDTNNQWNSNLSGTLVGIPTEITGYNSIIITINSTLVSATNGIEIYMYNEGETPTAFYTDLYSMANIVYIRSFLITKKYYYVKFIPLDTSTYTINLSSRLSVSVPEGIINNFTDITNFNNATEQEYDAFGKLRVSQPLTLSDIKFPSLPSGYGTTEFLTNYYLVASDSSGTYTVSNNAAGCLTITGTGVGHYISQSRKFNVYQPGKSMLIKLSGILMPNDGSSYVSGFTGRIGYYSNNPLTGSTNYTTVYNGIFYQYDSLGCSINIYRNGSPIYANYPCYQTNWNVDSLNGNGPSKINLDFSKTQLFVIDLEWLGVGRIRFGFYINGKIYYCHYENNLNSLIAPYTSNMDLPTRYELIGTGTGTASMKRICSTVISEGGYNPYGRPFGIGTTAGVSVAATEVAIMAVTGGGTNYFHQNIVPITIEIVDITNNNTNKYFLRIYYDNPSLVSSITTWTSVNTANSSTQYATSGLPVTIPTGSILVTEGIFYGRGNVNFGNLSNIFTDKVLHLTSNISNTPCVLLLTSQRIAGSNSSNVFATMTINEYY